MKRFALTVLAAAAAGCTTPRYAYHSSYELSACSPGLTRDKVAQALVRLGYVHAAEQHGPLDIYHRPDIVKKGPLAQEPYEDKAGDFAVAVCPGTSESYLVSEEWTSCKNHKDCTAENQRDLRKLAGKLGLQSIRTLGTFRELEAG